MGKDSTAALTQAVELVAFGTRQKNDIEEKCKVLSKSA